MEAALFVSGFVALAVACFLPMWIAEANRKQKERRMAEHRMNARLLRLDI